VTDKRERDAEAASQAERHGVSGLLRDPDFLEGMSTEEAADREMSGWLFYSNWLLYGDCDPRVKGYVYSRILRVRGVIGGGR
jgi:hypothetical protein